MRNKLNALCRADAAVPARVVCCSYQPDGRSLFSSLLHAAAFAFQVRSSPYTPTRCPPCRSSRPAAACAARRPSRCCACFMPRRTRVPLHRKNARDDSLSSRNPPPPPFVVKLARVRAATRSRESSQGILSACTELTLLPDWRPAGGSCVALCCCARLFSRHLSW